MSSTRHPRHNPVLPPPLPTGPVNQVLPAIAGTKTQGFTLTVDTGTWSPLATSYTYQWRRCDSGGANCANIASATGNTYVLAVADVGSTIRCVVTATNAGGSTPATSAATTVVAAAPTPKIYWGAIIGGGQYSPPVADWPGTASTAYTSYVANVGKAPSVIGWGHSWRTTGGVQTFNTAGKPGADRVIAQGAIPMLTWSPQESGAGLTQTDFKLSKITAGSLNSIAVGTTFDQYVDTYATQVLAWATGGNVLGIPVPIMIRMAHEMNLPGNFCWSEGVNGNVAGDYLAFWQHVVTRFKAICPNATFVWCPNITTAASGSAISTMYPGDAYVDWTGIDGYNKLTGGSWKTFNAVFTTNERNNLTGSVYSKLTTTIAPTKPVAICEFGCVNDTVSGNKATWITDAYTTQIKTVYTAFKCIVYYNKNTYPDTVNHVDIEFSTPAGSAVTAAHGALTADTYFQPGSADWLASFGHALVVPLT